MRKSDLENRMVVEINDGSRGLIVDNRIITSTGYLFLDDYNDDLTNEYSPVSDIVKVWSKTIVLDDIYKDGFNELLWEKPWKPEIGETYHYADATSEDFVGTYEWKDNGFDNRLFDRRLVFKTKEEARERAKKMLDSIKK